MNSIKSSLSFLPPNLRDGQKTPLYPYATDVLDKALELTYFSEINKLKSLYDPTSDYYDTSYILDLLGEATLKNLLSDVTDQVSLTMIVSDIQNIKGTKAAFYAILKLLKINYKTIIFKRLDNGCTEVTLVFEQGQRINVDDIALLDKYAQEVFPLCLNLTGVTNCTAYSVAGVYSGFNTVDLGMHFLDRTFVLDMSKMDTTYGIIDPRVSSTIAMLICNATKTDVVIPDLVFDTLRTRNHSTAMYYGRGNSIFLDINLKLDRFSPIDYYGFDVAHGRLSSTEMVYPVSNLAADEIYLSPKYMFKLDRSLMDIKAFEPLDGLRSSVKKINTLDRGLILDAQGVDLANKIVSQVTRPQLRPYKTSSPLTTTVVADTKEYSYKLRLDYEYNSASMYLPALTI